MEKNKSGIYKIINLITGDFYIGSAVNFKSRWSKHKNTLIKITHYNKYLQRAWNKYGEINFKFTILEEILDKTILLEKEQYYMDYLKPKYNICKTAGSILGHKFSTEIRKKISEASKGRKHTEETKKRMSEICKERYKNNPQPSGINSPLFGRTYSPESIERYRESAKKRVIRNGKTSNKGIDMICLKTNIILRSFSSIKSACDFIGKTKTSTSVISKVCKEIPGHYTAYGYKWKYAEF